MGLQLIAVQGEAKSTMAVKEAQASLKTPLFVVKLKKVKNMREFMELAKDNLFPEDFQYLGEKVSFSSDAGLKALEKISFKMQSHRGTETTMFVGGKMIRHRYIGSTAFVLNGREIATEFNEPMSSLYEKINKALPGTRSSGTWRKLFGETAFASSFAEAADKVAGASVQTAWTRAKNNEECKQLAPVFAACQSLSQEVAKVGATRTGQVQAQQRQRGYQERLAVRRGTLSERRADRARILAEIQAVQKQIADAAPEALTAQNGKDLAEKVNRLSTLQRQLAEVESEVQGLEASEQEAGRAVTASEETGHGQITALGRIVQQVGTAIDEYSKSKGSPQEVQSILGKVNCGEGGEELGRWAFHVGWGSDNKGQDHLNACFKKAMALAEQLQIPFQSAYLGRSASPRVPATRDERR